MNQPQEHPFDVPSPAVREALETQEQEDTLDTLVRDLTTVHPMPKSEVRRRLSDFIERAKAERDEEIRDWVEIRARADHMDASGKIYGHGSDYCKGWGQCSTDLINFLDTPQEENRKEL